MRSAALPVALCLAALSAAPAVAFLAPLPAASAHIQAHGRRSVSMCVEPGAAPALRAAVGRREVLGAAVLAGVLFPYAGAARAEAAVVQEGQEYKSEKFGYSLTFPNDWKAGNKPVRTHLDEINIKGSGGSELGVSVDPVKIDSLEAFGTAKEVAKKVLGAEKARDGVTTAKMLAYKKEQIDGKTYYIIEYESETSRGDKHFIAKVAIEDKKLYVLTAQAKQGKFAEDEQKLRTGVASFRVSIP